MIILAGPYVLGLIVWGVAEAVDNAPGYLRGVRIHWLERRAERRRADGSRGPLARWAQHQAEDPDGSLLAEAYRAAREQQRAAVRQALLRQLATGDAQQITLATADGDLTAARNTTAELLRHPLGLLTLTDFNTVASLLLTQPSKPLELLAACLDYRFGSEIAFGEQVPVTPGSPDDIAISPGLARQPHAQA